MGSSTKFEKPQIEVGRSPTRCPYCHDDVKPAESGWVVCRDCLARHHKECWEDSARCSSCGQTTYLEPAGMTVFRTAQPPPAERLQKPGEWPTLVVDRKGGGDHATIGEAIRAARPGMKIMIAAGTYNESVVIDKPLALIGRGRMSEIVIESDGSDCVVMETDQAMVRGVTLRARPGLTHAAHAVVRVSRGILRLWDCDVASDSLWPCVSVSGDGNPLVRRCRMKGGHAGGVLVADHGSGTFEDCELHGFRQYGIGVRVGANPTFLRCQIHGAPTGIFVDDGGKGSFRECDVMNAKETAVRVSQGGAPIFSKCRIHDSTRGVSVHDSGEGQFEECAITACQETNVLIERGGNPRFVRCKLDRSLGTGVTVTAAGRGHFDDCTVNENAQSGVSVLMGGDPSFERSKIRRNGRAGVWVRLSGRGSVEGCDLTQNDGGAWQVDGKCALRRRDNRE
jgi:F-box protein 11